MPNIYVWVMRRGTVSMERKLMKNMKKICFFPNLELLCQKRSAQVGMIMKTRLVSHQTSSPRLLNWWERQIFA